jgi:RecA-family ATPase
MTIENLTKLREQMLLKAEQERTEDKKKLPKILTTGQLLSRKTEAPKPIIHNLLHKGAKMQLAAPSKTYKTWCLIDLALSAGAGGQWMEQFECMQSQVLYLNFEIIDYFLEQRVTSVKEAKKLTDCDLVSWWPLRGYASDIEMLVDTVLEEIQSDDFDLVIVDPIYKALGGRSENDAGEMAEFLSHFDRLVHEINCSVVYSHHYAKGNALAKATMDRASGSGVLSRDPDQMVSLTRLSCRAKSRS